MTPIAGGQSEDQEKEKPNGEIGLLVYKMEQPDVKVTFYGNSPIK